ncbi:MAG: ABC transporter permease [Clostridiaceae bacterium]|nr:ABC transporter permease [Clostridiaceae bacterium]
MKHTMSKGIIRAVTGSVGRFLSIFAIVAIGCGLFAGVRSTGDEMRATTDRYFDQTGLSDAQIFSPLGFTETDAERFSGIEGVEYFMPVVSVTVASEHGDEMRNLRVQTYLAGDAHDRMNRPQLVEGRLPESASECVVEHRSIRDGSYAIGEKIHVLIESDSYESMFLRQKEFVVVGSVDSPLYLSFSWSAISIGSKEPRYNIFTNVDAFNPGRYNSLHFIFEGTAETFCYSPAYDDIVSSGTRELELKTQAWVVDRYREYRENKEGAFSEIPEKLITDFFESEIEPYFILTRDDVQGYTLFENDTQRVDGLARIFPVLFYLVSALVCLTTMTRMVEEERTQIGIQKALGYSTAAISVKYIAYALSAGLLGGLFGITVGFQIFPRVIYRPYLIMYRLPPIRPEFRFEHAWPALVFAVLAIVLATIFAIIKTLRSRPAQLMRPIPPLIGRSVPLEKIGFLWRSISFFHKVTVRNLFRYEKRLIMTILGIAGCTSLILTGFGLKNAVNDIIDKQFTQILTHDYRIYTKQSLAQNDEEGIVLMLADIKGISEVCPVFAQTVRMGDGDENNMEVSLLVPSNPDLFRRFYNLRERESRAPISLPSDQVVISEKAAILLGIQKGDSVLIQPEGKEAFESTVYAIAENYVEHYLYMSPEYASRRLGGMGEYNVLLAQTEDMSNAERERLASEILEQDSFSALLSYSKVKEHMHEIFKNLDALIYVLIGSAFALALIVLYNLTNINVRERIREIATLKVLGFYDSEVSSYVFRENAVLTLLGAAPGLLIGMFMHSSVTLSGEVDMIMFGRDIHPSSFFFAYLITCAFSMVIHGIMHFYLKRIRMVESLKSVE